MSVHPLNNSAPPAYPSPSASRPVAEGAPPKPSTSANPVNSGTADSGSARPVESKESVRQATQKVNQLIVGLSSDLKFTVDEDTGSNVVKVIDSRTKEIIRQIPAQEMLDIAKRLDELTGLLIKEQV